ncbi:MAG: DUF3438 family protein, partial [Gammaproteobacteria bacterium]
LRRVTPMEVIDAISRTYNLWYKVDSKSNIVQIFTVREYRLEQVDFKKERSRIFTMKNAKNALDLADTIQNLFGDRVYLSFGENQDELMEDLSDRFQRFNLIDRQTRLGIGGGSGGGGGGNRNSSNNRNNPGGGNNFNNFGGGSSGGRNRDTGGGRRSSSRGEGSEDELENTLRSTAATLDRFTNTRGGQAGLSNLLTGDSAQTQYMMNLAIYHQAPIYVSVIRRQNRVLVRTRDDEAMDEIVGLYQKLDTESSMLMMEVKILSIDLSDGYNSLFDFKIKSGDLNLATDNATGTVGGISSLDTTLRAAASVFDPALLATVVSDKFEARLQLLENEGRVTELATPMLVTTNQEVSRIFVGEERPIVTGYESSSVGSNSSVQINTSNVQPILVPVSEIRAIGTTLLLTPNINADRSVDVHVLVEQSTLGENQATIPVPLGDDLVDASIDIVKERTFSGTVVAKDTKAVAVGGLIEEGATDREKKVPILGDIPVLGFFFKEKADSRLRRELVVIIRPHIMATPTEAQTVSKHWLEDNTTHPQAPDAGRMDIYRNRRREHRGYELQEPYKLYDRQDLFDRHHGKGGLGGSPEHDFPPDPVSQGARDAYMELTRYAAESVRLPREQRRRANGIYEAALLTRTPIGLSPDNRLKTVPVASWYRGGVTVTALEVHNRSKSPVRFDPRAIRGNWLASTIEDANLAPKGEWGDSSYLYLVSGQPFDEIAPGLEPD